ncbi:MULTISPECIES: putative zinc ribbon protein [Klebsiella]|jgi:hypothetical protein|uniref:putative zinc ribbon protein n=1 Tax=Klebsiella TaxID=570 RepID=UPI0018C84863|nr:MULTISPECIES: putative zinc ribbon protein [Klebsiella]HBQ8029082.1 hypothetical protein [Klebsiella aerogenes]HBR1445176.1 hypothetical protein [Klebsiella quasipneumoniae subsp. quasipneumoniae]HBW1982920.1 hypothetical protein [Klebsiella quasipneumoniae subsp. similipneumoniae]MBG2576007.1 hypothetical protein [Klebsiella oxytoca]MCW9198926.1 zinc-ribbon domain-containing protein [Klebsiella pneumoniae]
MQFRTIRTALDHKGQVAHTRNLSPRSRGAWYCRSCNNPLRLHWTHDCGGYFEHHLEEAEVHRLMHCEYRVISQYKPISAFEQAVKALIERDDVSVIAPSEKDYFCVLCQRDYHGQRCCPECGEHIYSTEMNDLDTLTIPVTFAK